jgi:CRP-like cAMP-binding protein
MQLIDRFKDQRVFIDALRAQYIVQGNGAIAADLAKVANLSQHPAGTPLIQQGAHDNHIFFILAGKVAVYINGQELARRRAGQHVGEMAMIDSAAPRSGSVIARDTVVLAEVSEADFSDISSKHPVVWRRIAEQLCDRLRQRSRFVRERNDTPIIFLGSSRESLPVVTLLSTI